MIDLQTETVLTLNEAREHLPRRRNGSRPHPSTMWRWSTAGYRGIVLETVQVGGTRCTSLEAIQRFVERLSGAESRPKSVGNERRLADVEAELSAAGI